MWESLLTVICYSSIMSNVKLCAGIRGGAAESGHARDRGGPHRRQAPKVARPVAPHTPSKKCTIM